ncbi:acyltransferase family protein [Flavobacterium subsaxonicum]|uniref:Acyltransferase 3 domain-containing protein n=1 Tax=Flavobacterium subsaxonicum WB 4.1-42 = DSM 21790 TaxID=1121898 RepID=A0A0A2MWA2_9FLAO|nr:acyltransferase [Flavobacterium subsaxonicum]KGO92510.1 hypothetical protein Q766_12060 [Flavobacterium subsaxonicum WB 4.1-42 = DSM 21790]
MSRIKSLDGIRAISILMVLIGHASETMPKSLKENILFMFIANGSLGVKIFFVISGFLITKLLLIEKKKNGKINLKDFYLRRIFRIFPVFYLYIIVILFLKYTLIPNIFNNFTLVGFACVYLWNYKHLLVSDTTPDNGNWFFGHFWSLSMEEQFYLVWPVMFIKIKNMSLLIKIVAVIIILMPIVRIATYFLMPDSRGQLGMMLQTGGDSILVGCLAALLEQNTKFKKVAVKYYSNGYLIALSALFIFILSPLLNSKLGGTYSVTLGHSINNIFIIILIFWCIYIPSKVANVLNSRVLVQIGILSYSLYIWQQLFLTNRTDLWVNKFPQNIIIVVFVAFISYYVVEKPILNIKKRFKKV